MLATQAQLRKVKGGNSPRSTDPKELNIATNKTTATAGMATASKKGTQPRHKATQARLKSTARGRHGPQARLQKDTATRQVVRPQHPPTGTNSTRTTQARNLDPHQQDSELGINEEPMRYS